MRRYETVFIADSELTDEQRESLLDKLQGLVSQDQGMLVTLDQWGHKRLAYEIKKQTRGYYVLMDYCGDGALVKEIERNMRLDDRVLKYMTVLKDTTVDLESIRADIEAAKAQEAELESAKQTADKPATETADESATETAGKPGPESTETEEAPLSESEASEETPESSDQEEQEDETK